MLDDNEENRAAQSDLIEMEKMLNGYLDFARGQTDEESVEVSINELLLEISEKSKPNPPVLDLADDKAVLIKRGMMTRAFNNILSNANKYGDMVRVVSNLDKNSIMISVEDDGPGIPEEKHKDVFKPFFRLDTARNQNVEGTGLGLSIARDIIRNHGGSIDLGRSDLGGLKVDIILPA